LAAAYSTGGDGHAVRHGSISAAKCRARASSSASSATCHASALRPSVRTSWASSIAIITSGFTGVHWHACDGAKSADAISGAQPHQALLELFCAAD
jgi:hypothetical protein